MYSVHDTRIREDSGTNKAYHMRVVRKGYYVEGGEHTSVLREHVAQCHISGLGHDVSGAVTTHTVISKTRTYGRKAGNIRILVAYDSVLR